MNTLPKKEPERESSREGPATKNLAEVFVELEPVRENSEDEQEDGKTEQHQRRHDAHGIPDLSSSFRDEVVER
jgi:hypothetical protein